MPTYIRLRQLADEAACALNTVYEAERNHRLNVIVIAGLKVVTREEADRFIRAPRQRPGRPRLYRAQPVQYAAAGG